jgi:hypothetical protein
VIRCLGADALISGTVVVVAEAGAGCPGICIAAAPAELPTDLDFFLPLPFFFSYH